MEPPTIHSSARPNEENSSREIVLRSSVRIDRRLRPRVRSCAAFRHAQHPLDRFKIHLADIGIILGFFGVSEGRIKDAPFAVHFVPGYGEIMIRSVDARVVCIV